jgi:hypothetical protein
MRQLRNSLLVVLFLATVYYPQINNSAPEYGTLEEIKDARKAYVYSEDLESRDLILKELSKDTLIEVVGKIEDAEFFIFYGSSFIETGYASFGGIFGSLGGAITTKTISEVAEYYVIKKGDKL